MIVWMMIIFSASTDSGSSSHTSRLIEPFLRWLYPSISKAAANRIVTVIRKGAHVTEYALLATLIWRAWRRTRPRLPEKIENKSPPRRSPLSTWLTFDQPWVGGQALAAIVLTGLYAASDEIHQSFVPSRDARISDVLLDTSGAVLAMLVIWSISRWWRRWQSP